MLKWLNYGFLIPCLIALYYKPSIFVVNNSLTTGLMICAVILAVLRLIYQYYGNALYKHCSDMLIVTKTGLEFCNHDSGYKFQRNYEDIVSVKYTRLFGAPKVKIRFINNELYNFIWFKDAHGLYTELKNNVLRGVTEFKK